MESENEEFKTAIDISSSRLHRPRSFALFEEYSGTSIDSTVTGRRKKFDTADLAARREKSLEVDREVCVFSAWLVEVKGFESLSAHFHAVGLRSLLMGLPVGVQFAEMFGALLEKSGF
jgi:hypothetical protein